MPHNWIIFLITAILIVLISITTQTSADSSRVATKLELDPLPSKLFVGETIVFTGRLTTSDGKPLSDMQIDIVKLLPKPELVTIASTTTDTQGNFKVEWIAELTQKEIIPSDVTKQFLSEVIVVYAQFNGNESFLSSRTGKWTLALEADRIFTFINSDKLLYRPGEPVTVFIAFVDSNDQFVDPDAIEVYFDNKPVVLEKRRIGSYVLFLTDLDKEHHQLIVTAERSSFNVNTAYLTILVAEVSDKQLKSFTFQFSKAVDVILNIADFINLLSIDFLRVVDADNKIETVDDLVENTMFISTDGTQQGLVKLTDIEVPEEVLSEYREALTAAQGWGDRWVSAVESGDTVAKVRWSVEGHDTDITSNAILDKNGQVKFEPLMYFTPGEVIVGGSHHKLVVKNFLGMTVIVAELNADVYSSDNCVIITNDDSIPLFKGRHLPLWHYDHIKRAQKLPSGECPSDVGKELYCAKAEAKIVYSAFMPNWEIDINKFEAKKSDLPMGGGDEYLYTDMTCADRTIR